MEENFIQLLHTHKDFLIYLTTLEEEHTKYRVYDWNGNLFYEITPYDSLGESKNGAIEVALKSMEYSAIVKVWNNQIIGSYNGELDMKNGSD